ncbi:Zn-ribbon domain-containing OB-fold protein [Planotetraspora sp. GP83]|uniref:Zn-ribbon domain-containing OB-fold protein n=1 Tax=Planotetraspora sp. GP83 TaxID=3156264 RepID=UPI00351913DA
MASDPLTAPYWDACRRRELVIQACTACARRVHLPALQCPYCGCAELTWEPVSGEGVVHTFTVVHRSFVTPEREPYAVAWIDLAEGARAFGEIVGCPHDGIHIGMPVRVSWDEHSSLPKWRPA